MPVNREEFEKTAALLESIDRDTSKDWKHVGHVLIELEKISRLDEDGNPWIDMVLKRIAEVDRKVSRNHLYKVRRSCAFLRTGMKLLDLPPEAARKARIATIDAAEKLYQLDNRLGLRALKDALRTSKTSTSRDIEKRLEAYLKKNPQQTSPLQAAAKRRYNKSGQKSEEKIVEFSTEIEPEDFLYLNPETGSFCPLKTLSKGKAEIYQFSDDAPVGIIDITKDGAQVSAFRVGRSDIDMSFAMSEGKFEDYVLTTLGDIILSKRSAA